MVILTLAGQCPTLPNPYYLKKGSNGWRRTDLADGEYGINSKDDLYFWRSGVQIFTLDINYVLSFINDTNNLFNTETFYATAGQTAFPTTFTTSALSKVFLNGSRLTEGFTIVAGVVTFSHGQEENSQIIIDRF